MHGREEKGGVAVWWVNQERNYWKNKSRWVKSIKMALICPMSVPDLKT